MDQTYKNLRAMTQLIVNQAHPVCKIDRVSPVVSWDADSRPPFGEITNNMRFTPPGKHR
jgi:hypothetical protein